MALAFVVLAITICSVSEIAYSGLDQCLFAAEAEYQPGIEKIFLTVYHYDEPTCNHGCSHDYGTIVCETWWGSILVQIVDMEFVEDYGDYTEWFGEADYEGAPNYVVFKHIECLSCQLGCIITGI